MQGLAKPKSSFGSIATEQLCLSTELEPLLIPSEDLQQLRRHHRISQIIAAFVNPCRPLLGDAAHKLTSAAVKASSRSGSAT